MRSPARGRGTTSLPESRHSTSAGIFRARTRASIEMLEMSEPFQRPRMALERSDAPSAIGAGSGRRKLKEAAKAPQGSSAMARQQRQSERAREGAEESACENAGAERQWRAWKQGREEEEAVRKKETRPSSCGLYGRRGEGSGIGRMA